MRDPHETIVRNVLIFPADGGEPRISPMTFSEAGAKSNPYGLYTVNVDLWSLYGNRNMHATRSQGWDMTNQPHDVMNGAYDVFHNISPKLPINITMARIVGVDPNRPGQRPLWRGDVVAVKTSEWPEPIPTGAGAHMDYLDFPPQALELFVSRYISMWYNSNQWRDFLDSERRNNEATLESDKTWPFLQQSYPIIADQPSGFDQKKYDKTARLLNRLKATEAKRVHQQDLDKIVACGQCKINASSLAHELKVCGGCRNEKYCSVECQTLAWKEHKAACKASRNNDSG